jgi:hypothetical protein
MVHLLFKGAGKASVLMPAPTDTPTMSLAMMPLVLVVALVADSHSLLKRIPG